MQAVLNFISTHPWAQAAAYALTALVATYLLWVFFLAVMHLRDARDDKRLSPVALKLGYPVLFVGYLLDVLVQYTLACLIFMELPEETTVSGRSKRLAQRDNSWRGDWARWLRANLLGPFDRTGDHS